MKSVVTITMNPSIDQSCQTPFVTDEKKLRCKEVRFDPGGGGINVSRAIKIFGGKSIAIYPSGGYTGALLKELLNEKGIDQIPLTVSEPTRINVSVFETNSEKQYRFNMPGILLQDQEWKQVIQQLEQCNPYPDFIVASGSLPPGVPKDFYKTLARFSHKNGCKLIVDSSHEPLQEALHEGIFLMKPNLKEFMFLTDKEIEDESQIIRKAQEIIKNQQCEVIVISLGAAGAYYITSETFTHIPSPLVPLSSRVGAGDCMVAGITYQLSLGNSIDQAIFYGIAAGAAAAMTPGTELCKKEDTERLYHLILKKRIKLHDCHF